MSETMDPDTGELPFVPNGGRVAAHAASVALTDRSMRRAELRGDGKTSIYRKLAAAYAKIPAVIKNNKPGARGVYTSYDYIVAIVRPILLEQGVIFKHRAGHVFQLGDGQAKTCWLPVATDFIDIESGEVVECEIPIPVPRQDPQALGGAFPYGKRYSLLGGLGSATGDVTEDDDAESAMPRKIADEGEAAEIVRDIAATTTEAEASKLKAAYDKRIQKLSAEEFEQVKVAYQAHVKKLREAPAEKAKK
jgi:hypothetical protein